ncbi:hypothetical protein [Nocardioides cavernaquae]|uniref:Cell wall protein n=1 Tax=Nocardioides cavernaquae TaxID=2321396 RepID=A0A3A5H1W2_9ACTN|nr:hypothetical protein [Nocardioides cavernaquae]RJS44816.1 hypothetical protein D4739_00210 [Nocardioides cavernaquae]
MRFSKASFVAGAAAALVLGSGTAFAATGGKFILGKANTATTVTTLTNNYGTALTLNSKAGQPSLRVNRNVKVPNLNSDLLDGKDSTAFALKSGQVGTIVGWGYYINYNDSNVPAFVAADATCPAGTKLVGGGGEDYTDGGSLWVTAPFGNAWSVASSWSPAPETEGGSDYPDPSELLIATAQCWNPTGAVPGAQPMPRKAMQERVAARMAAR